MRLNTYSTYKKKLIDKLKSKEYRDSFVASHINDGIPFQIRTMRNKRGITQEELGNLANMKQTAICRLENPNSTGFSINTLKQIASAFDVALIIRFVDFGDLVKWDLNLSEDSLNAESFNEDKYFTQKETISAGLLKAINPDIDKKDENKKESKIIDFTQLGQKQSEYPATTSWGKI